jgi:plastocyanin
MRHVSMALAVAVGILLMVTVTASAHRVKILDDCDPRDPAWVPTGGCTLKEGDVTLEEFNAELRSPLADAVIGHQAWQNDPTYLKIEVGETVRVKNAGGRLHTFTEVENFGAGRIPNPALNFGLDPAPECTNPDLPSTDVAPGDTLKVKGLSLGNHRFQCCIHPWMRTLIKVLPEGDDAHNH